MIHKNWVSWCWQLGIFGAMIAGAIASGFDCALAQSKIVPDGTLGSESSRVLPNDNGFPIEEIRGGAIRGSNLFHSFLEFNVSVGRGAYFYSPNVEIQNILARVTGSNRSEILGTIGTFGASNPNLFLINPNGIMFGANASLDMGNAGPNVGGTGGSFVATTANAVLLGNNGIFSASEPAKSNLLSVNPSALLFNAISGQSIVNKSTATQTVLGNDTYGLQVPNGRSLLLVGGDVQLDGGNLFVPDGRVELGGVSGTGTVGLNVDGNYLSLSFPQQVQLADVSLINGCIISVPASDGGSTAINASNQDILGGINITARSVAVTDGAQLLTDSKGQGNAGNVRINARDTVTFDGTDSNGYSIGIFSTVQKGTVGTGGDINITTTSLIVRNGAALLTGTYGQGNAGNITINARDRGVIERAVGKAGNINITTGSLALTNNAELSTTTYGQASAGNVTINARDTVNFDDSAVLSAVNQKGVGRGGIIDITTGSLAVTNGAQVDTSTFGRGDAGSVRINARDTATIDGVDSNVSPSGIFSTVQATGVGRGGIIDITTGSLAVTHGGRISTRTLGQGNAGSVKINASDTVQLNNGGIFTNATSNGGGDVTLNARDIRLRNNSLIRTDFSSGQGSGGNITLTANTILALEDSDILAFASQGRGGNITFNTRAFLSDPLYRPSVPTTEEATFASFNHNGRVDVNASGAVSGGNITGVPDISFIQNSLTELPQNLINPNVLIANSCIARSSKQQGTFTITGAGGLPNRPGDAVLSTYPTGDVRSVPGGAASRPWYKGDPIVEPQGLYHLTNGHLVLSRECFE